VDLLIVRHSLASSRAARDEDRPLTEEGLRRALEVAWAVGRLGFRGARILHSPLLRALETATVFEAELGATRVACDRLALEPGDRLLEELAGDRVIAVGHQPWVSELCAWLVHGDRSQWGAVRFEPCAAAWLQGQQVAPGRMWLSGFIPPAVCALGGAERG